MDFPSPNSPTSLRPRIARASDEAETYRLLAKAVRRVCPAWLRNESEELVQKACLKVVEAQSRRGETLDLCSSYLHRIAFSVVVDEIRSRQRRIQTLISDKEGNAADSATDQSSPSPESAVLSGAQRTDIVECLNRLQESRRLALTLRLQGHGNIESAEILGMSQKQVANLVHRGRQNLRDCLESKGVYRG